MADKYQGPEGGEAGVADEGEGVGGVEENTVRLEAEVDAR
jgi:hypothetical protein